jgi:hypothetical protein
MKKNIPSENADMSNDKGQVTKVTRLPSPKAYGFY